MFCALWLQFSWFLSSQLLSLWMKQHRHPVNHSLAAETCLSAHSCVLSVRVNIPIFTLIMPCCHHLHNCKLCVLEPVTFKHSSLRISFNHQTQTAFLLQKTFHKVILISLISTHDIFVLQYLQDNKGSIFKSPTILTAKGGTFYALVILKGLHFVVTSCHQSFSKSDSVRIIKWWILYLINNVITK